MVGEPSIGVGGRRMATDCVDHTLASGRGLTNTLMRLAAGRRNRIARRGVVVIEVANVLVVLVGFHVRILRPVVGACCKREAACSGEGDSGGERQEAPFHWRSPSFNVAHQITRE